MSGPRSKSFNGAIKLAQYANDLSSWFFLVCPKLKDSDVDLFIFNTSFNLFY